MRPSTTPQRATTTGPPALGDRMISPDGVEATVSKLEIRGGLGAVPRETWARLDLDDGGQHWVRIERPELEGDEVAVVALIHERLQLGRGQYGPLRAARDIRDWPHEALEELLDGCVYLACELLRQGRIE